MKIISFNTGLLHFKLFGITILKPTNYLEERLLHIPKKLIKTNSDIICLQEVYRKRDKEFLIDKLKRTYPHFAKSDKKKIIGFNDGLLIFSKYPIIDFVFEKMKKQPFEERLLSRKGILLIGVDLNGNKTLIANTHTTASGIDFNQDNKRIDKLREAQIKQTINICNNFKSLNNYKLSLITGDFNCGPQISKSNYEIFKNSNYIDTYLINNLAEQGTWNPQNILNQESGVFKNAPEQRIDFIFVDDEWEKIYEECYSEIIFDNPEYEINPNKKIPLSDHYAIISTFK